MTPSSRPNPLLRVTAWLVACFLLLPILVVIPISFTPARFLSLPSGELSLRHYVKLVTDERWILSVSDSLLVAISAAGLSVILGVAFAVGAWRLGVASGRWLRVLMLAPMIVPPIVHAVAFYRAWAQIGLIDTYLGLVLVHTMKGVPFVVLSVAASLANMDPRLEQAARSLGATTAQSMRWVVLPQLTPGVIAGATFAFITSWDEIVVALFITSRAVYTLPRRIWDGLADNIDPAIAALGSLLVLATVMIAIIQEFRRSKKTADV